MGTLLRSPTPPNRNNFGPADELAVQLAKTSTGDGRRWNWVVYLAIQPTKRVQYAFEFSAHNENEICLYEYPSWDRIRIRRINNYFFELPGRAWEFTNDEHDVVYHVLTGWHKNTAPSGGQPWWQSPADYDDSRSREIVIGFADNWYNPPFSNGKITILRDGRDDATPYYHEEAPI